MSLETPQPANNNQPPRIKYAEGFSHEGLDTVTLEKIATAYFAIKDFESKNTESASTHDQNQDAASYALVRKIDHRTLYKYLTEEFETLDISMKRAVRDVTLERISKGQVEPLVEYT